MNKRARSRRRKKKHVPVKTMIVALAAVLAAAGTASGYYINRSRQYETVFFPHTVINGMDVSHKTAEEVKALIAAGIEDYQLTIQLRGGETETITREEIGLKSVFDGSLEEYLSAQEPMRWWQYRSQGTEYEIAAMIDFDEGKLQERLDSMECFSQERMQEPKDAYLSEYQPGQGYVVIPEEQGSLLNRQAAQQAIREAIGKLRKEVSLEETGAYAEPEVTAEDETLNALAKEMNRYAGVTVTYRFGDKQEVLDGELISQWISVGENQQVILDSEQVAAYVKQLASMYDTAYKKKNFQTSYGKSVTVSPAIYGWRINRGKEAEALYDIIRSGESQTREPIYSQTANSRGVNDYGDTYVEINLTAQRLFFYKDGKLIVETDFVSGSHAKGYDTPAGAYPLTYKERNATLRGEDYETPVSYWMPFNGNIGMHDANWRSSFGGQIYMTSGSHGCINLPPEAAKKIYEHISAGDPVICYHLEGTARGKASQAGGNGAATETAAAAQTTTGQTVGEQNPEGQTEPGQTTPGQTEPGQTTPGQTEPGQTEPGQTTPGQTVGEQTQEGPIAAGQASGEQNAPGLTMPGQAAPGQDSEEPKNEAGTRNPGNTGEESQSGIAGPGAQTQETTEGYGPGYQSREHLPEPDTERTTEEIGPGIS